MRWRKWSTLAVLSLAAPAQQLLTLEQAVRTALEKHPSLAASKARLEAAERKVEGARAGYLPKVNLQESWQRGNNPVFVFSSLLTQRQFTEKNFQIDSLNRPDFLNNFQSLITIEQMVYDGGMTKLGVQAAGLGGDLAREEDRGSRMHRVASVVRAYSGALLAAEALRVAEQAVRSAEADQQRAETVRAAGMATDADVLSMRVHVAAMRELQIQRQADLDVARAALNEAMGQPLDQSFQLVTALQPVAAPALEPSDYEKRAEADRPEARATLALSRLAETQAENARAAYKPQVFVRGVFEADRQRFVTRGGANWVLAAGVRWNLFNGFADRARLRESQASAMASRADRQKTAAELRLQVRRAYAAWLAAQERIAVTTAAVEQAVESLRITRNRYENGLNTVTDLLRNQTAELEARMRRLAAIHDQRIAATMLELAAGALTEDSYVLR